MAKAGRPTDYTPELADKICAGIVSGLSLVSICKSKNMPCETSVYKWLREHQEFADNYTRAREDQADYYADQIIEIADTSEDAAKGRLQVDARKWVSSKLKPKKYGDKTQLTGADGAGPVEVDNNVTVTFVKADDKD